MKTNIIYFICISLCFFFLLFSIVGCSKTDDNDKNIGIENHIKSNYTHKSGGNNSAAQKKVTSINSINVKIVEHIMFIDDQKFDDLDKSIEFLYHLKKSKDLPVILDLKESKAKTVILFKEGLKEKRISYKIKES